MSQKTSKNKTRAVTTTGIRADDLVRLADMAKSNRLINVEAIGVLLDAWDSLGFDQQSAILRRQAAEPALAK